MEENTNQNVTQMGNILSLEGDMALVRFKRTDACGHCNACFHLGSNEADIEILNTLAAKPGDTVSIQMHSTSVLKASTITYGGPLLVFLLGIFVGSQFSEVAAVVGGIASFGVSFLILRALEPRFSRMSSFKPRMLEILEDEPESCPSCPTAIAAKKAKDRE